jgi:hypothetical protein
MSLLLQGTAKEMLPEMAMQLIKSQGSTGPHQEGAYQMDNQWQREDGRGQGQKNNAITHQWYHV